MRISYYVYVLAYISRPREMYYGLDDRMLTPEIQLCRSKFIDNDFISNETFVGKGCEYIPKRILNPPTKFEMLMKFLLNETL